MAEQKFDEALALCGDYNYTEKTYYTKVVVESTVDDALTTELLPFRSTERMKRVYTLFDTHKRWSFTGDAVKLVDDYISQGINTLPDDIRPGMALPTNCMMQLFLHKVSDGMYDVVKQLLSEDWVYFLSDTHTHYIYSVYYAHFIFIVAHIYTHLFIYVHIYP